MFIVLSIVGLIVLFFEFFKCTGIQVYIYAPIHLRAYKSVTEVHICNAHSGDNFMSKFNILIYT